MRETKIHEYARQLFAARGAAAIADAAEKSRSLSDRRDEEEAETWRRIGAALRLMQGPHQG